MLYNPKFRSTLVARHFMFTMYGLQLIFIDIFKYLGHIVCCNLYNDEGIKKEIHNFVYSY